LTEEQSSKIDKLLALYEEKESFSPSKMFKHGFSNGKGLTNILRILLLIVVGAVMYVGTTLKGSIESISNLPVLEKQVERNTRCVEKITVQVGELREDVIRLQSKGY